MSYDEAHIQKLLDHIANGGSLIKFLDANGPTRVEFYKWLRSDENKVGDLTLWEAYQQARELQAEYYADLINDDAINAEKAVIDAANNPDIDKRAISNLVQARRLKIDSLKWTASKLKPGTYGDKVQHEGNKDNPLRIEIVNYAEKPSD